MKNVLFLLLLIVVSTSCKKDDIAKTLSETYDASQATLLASSSFSNGSHTTSGTVKFYSKNGINSLVFEDFSTESGPDLRVYLSTSLGNDDYKEAGKLKAISGSFYYNIDTAIHIDAYKNVLIWCEDFSVLFGKSRLQ
jgi:hypothetical protein